MLFCVGVRGPDDVIATRDYQEAVELANLLNAGFAAIVRKGFTENDPLMWASPGLWAYSAERHAADLAVPSVDYGDAVDAARRLADLRASKRGNGAFKWYWAVSDDSEIWHGALATRAEAEAAARAELADEPVDAFVDEPPHFYVAEADKSVVLPTLDDDWVTETLSERLAETNDECWGEDGWDDAWSQEALQQLGRMLNEAVAVWLAFYPAKTWSLNDWRVCEKVLIAPKASS